MGSPCFWDVSKSRVSCMISRILQIAFLFTGIALLGSCAGSQPTTPPCDTTLHNGQHVQTRTAADEPVRSQPNFTNVASGLIPSGTTETIIGGPTCVGDSQLWWQIETDNGIVSWINYGNPEEPNLVYYEE